MKPRLGWPLTVVIAVAWAVAALHIVSSIDTWLLPVIRHGGIE